MIGLAKKLEIQDIPNIGRACAEQGMYQCSGYYPLKETFEKGIARISGVISLNLNALGKNSRNNKWYRTGDCRAVGDPYFPKHSKLPRGKPTRH